MNANCEEISHFTVPCNEAQTSFSFSPDFLEPETTYYWRPTWGANIDGGCSSGFFGIGPLHSFTTEPPSATESTSWGRIKALYHR
jgi:hypothetical protein